MQNTDTVKLLRECDAGTKMAISSIDEVLDKVFNIQMKQSLIDSKARHEKIENDIITQLKIYQSNEKEPNPIAKGMSWMKTNMKISIDGSDSTIADLITDGCDMGIKSLNRYLNQYKAADGSAKEICTALVSAEEYLEKDMRKYL